MKFENTNKPVLENETHKLVWDFEIQTDHKISARRPDLLIINKKKRTCRIVDSADPSNHRLKLKESEKRDNYLTLERELKKLFNMKVTVIPIVIGALGTVSKGLIQGLEDMKVRGRVKTMQTISLLRSARILKRARET